MEAVFRHVQPVAPSSDPLAGWPATQRYWQGRLAPVRAPLRPVALAVTLPLAAVPTVPALRTWLELLRPIGTLDAQDRHEVCRAMTTPTPPQVAADETRLLERFRSGDRQAFGELVQRHQRQVYYLVWRYVRNDEDAKDLTQATFVRAWQNASNFRGDASVRTWLYRIAVNLALNHVRDRGRWQSSDIEPESLPVESATAERLVEAEVSQQLLKAVGQLPPKQRLVVELRVQEGLTFREVADVAECSEDAAKANFHHAIKRLRTLLSVDGQERQ